MSSSRRNPAAGRPRPARSGQSSRGGQPRSRPARRPTDGSGWAAAPGYYADDTDVSGWSPSFDPLDDEPPRYGEERGRYGEEARYGPEPERDGPFRPSPEPELPPVRPRGHYSGKRRRENAWASYALIIAVPLVLVLLIVGFSALPPYTPNSRAQSAPNAGGSGTSPGPDQSPTGTGAAHGPAVYEAEDAHNTLGPGTKLRAVAGASGGQVITSIGHGTPAGDVTFNAVTVPTAGRYTVTMYYLTNDQAAHRLAIFVNKARPIILTFPALPDPNQVGTLRTTVTLAAGTNTLRFSNATVAFGPDLDRITIQ